MNHYENTDKKSRLSPVMRQTLNACISLLVMIALTLIVYFFNVPNPNMILIAGLTVFTSLFGYPTGVVCGIEMIVYSMFFFSTDHSFFQYTDVNLQKMGVILLGVILNVAFIGHLKRRQTEANRRLTELNEKLETDNLILQEASETDALTGLKNRYALRKDYDRYQGKFLHVMMIDLDGFKQINDTYGHEKGDALLRHAGRVLRETFGGESSYRYGGDEFLVVCSGITREHFTARIDEIRSGFEAIAIDGCQLPIGFSAGYVFGDSDQPHDLRLMIRQADTEMYGAKRDGKNACHGAPYSRDVARAMEKRSGVARL